MIRPLILILALATSATARQPIRVVKPTNEFPSWSPSQATGAPNCPTAGDCTLSWTSLSSSQGIEWLEVTFERAVPIASIRVHENHNPGAITEIQAIVDGKAIELWEGKAPVKAAPHIFSIQPNLKVTAKTFKILLHTERIDGWNEIDAVQLLGKDGSMQWAQSAKASSTYATPKSMPGLTSLVGHKVIVKVGSETIRGVLKGVTGASLIVEQAGQAVYVNRTRVLFVRKQ